MHKPEPETHRGRLLVATPDLTDPNFAETVILLLEHSTAGALGVVLNRPSEVGLDDALPDWAGHAADPAVVFVGGPVQPNAVIGLAQALSPPVEAWEEVGPGVGVVDLASDAAVTTVTAVRVFAGYAGWAPDQLEAEVAEGAWFIVDAEPGDGFAPEPDQLWSRVLRRQGGVFVAATPDPSRN